MNQPHISHVIVSLWLIKDFVTCTIIMETVDYHEALISKLLHLIHSNCRIDKGINQKSNRS
jgi:hypothetical protein